MKNSAQKMKPGDVSLGLSHHFIGAFGRAGGTAAMLQRAADDRALMQRLVGLFQQTALVTAIAATFLTSDYFVIRPGLWVSNDFTSRITAAYPEVLVPRGLDGVESFDLTKVSWSSDYEILNRSEMGGEVNVRKHAVSPDQVAALIDLQPEGVSGRLLRNGGVNLFYMVGKNHDLSVVSVRWDADSHLWIVGAWDCDVLGSWATGTRVFYNAQDFEV